MLARVLKRKKLLLKNCPENWFLTPDEPGSHLGAIKNVDTDIPQIRTDIRVKFQVDRFPKKVGHKESGHSVLLHKTEVENKSKRQIIRLWIKRMPDILRSRFEYRGRCRAQYRVLARHMRVNTNVLFLSSDLIRTIRMLVKTAITKNRFSEPPHGTSSVWPVAGISVSTFVCCYRTDGRVVCGSRGTRRTSRNRRDRIAKRENEIINRPPPRPGFSKPFSSKTGIIKLKYFHR